MSNAIMIALGKPKHGMGGMSEEAGESEDQQKAEDKEGLELSDDEKVAAEAAYEADNAEEYGEALKAFIKLCMKEY